MKKKLFGIVAALACAVGLVFAVAPAFAGSATDVATLTKDGTEVGTYATIQEAVTAYDTANQDGNYCLTIKSGSYDAGDMVIREYGDKPLTVQAEAKGSVTLAFKSDGTHNSQAIFNISGMSQGTGAVTFDGIVFSLSGGGYSAIRAMSGGSGAVDPYFGDNNGRYARNITVKNCTFNGDYTSGSQGSYVLRADAGSQAGNVLFDSCTVSKVENFLSGYAYKSLGGTVNEYGIKIKDCNISGVNRFINNMGLGANVVVEGCTVACKNDYAIRAKGDIAVLNSKITNTGKDDTNNGGMIVCRTDKNPSDPSISVTISNSELNKPERYYDVWNDTVATTTITGGSNVIGKIALAADKTITGKDAWYNFPSPVAKIDSVEYGTLAEAIAAAKAGETIELLCNVELDCTAGSSALNVNKAGITIDGKGYTIKPAVNAALDKYKLGGANQRYGSYNLIIVSANDVTIKNLNVDVLDYRGMSCVTTTGGSNILYDNISMTGRGSGHYYGYASNGLVTFNNCTITTKGYGIHMANEGTTGDKVVINNSKVYGWNSFGTCESVTANNTYFGSANDEGKNGILAVFRPYCTTVLNNCTFSKEFAMGGQTGYTYVGLGTGAAVTVTLFGCSVEGGYALTDIVNYDDAFDNATAANGSMFVFDPIFDNASKYVAGTFVTKAAAASITCAVGSSPVKVGETDQTRSGSGSIYLVGKGAQGANNKITAGKFAVDPAKYIDQATYIVTNSGDNECPFLVKKKEAADPKQTEVIHENTEVKIAESEEVKAETPAEQEAVIVAAANTEVEGVKDAITEAGYNAILEDAKTVAGTTVTSQKINDATLIEYEVTAKVEVKACERVVDTEGSISFELKPVATVTTHENGVVTGVAENVPVDNSILNGDAIKVTVGCGDIVPVQAVHICSDGTIEVFTKGTKASHDDMTFLYDANNKTVTVEITQFSVIEITGTTTYGKVIFDANAKDAKGSMDSQGAELGKEATLNECAFTREGYTFEGWNTKADGTGTAYADKASITISEDVTLYAQWKEVVSPTPTPEPAPIPGTGDSAPLGSIALFALLAVAGLAIARKRLA